jgi:hypothetical protein
VERLALAADEACQLSASMGEDPALGWEDALALELLAWFKRDFFQWVSARPVAACAPLLQCLAPPPPFPWPAGMVCPRAWRCPSRGGSAEHACVPPLECG